MFSKARSWLGDLANAITLIGFMASVGLSGVLGIVSPTILQPILGLPDTLRVALGFCIFLVAFAVILTVLKALLQRHSQGKATQSPTPQSSEYSLWQELKRVETENRQLKETLQQSEQVNGQLRDWIETITPFMHRIQLRFVLQAIWRMGNNLRERQPPDVVAMEKWVSLTSSLIRRYLGDETANFFLVNDGDNSFDGRLRRLEDIFDKPVNSGGKLQSDFDSAEAIEPYPVEWANKYGV